MGFIGNEYGAAPKYQVGDRVRLWMVYKNPVGTVTSIVDVNAFPISYNVNYIYEDGREFTEPHESQNLTLVERSSKFFCNCHSNTDFHSTWCNRYNLKWGSHGT